jgi:hypothetical protein
MTAKQTRIKEGEEILSQVDFENESSGWFDLWINVGCVAIFCCVIYFLFH